MKVMMRDQQYEVVEHGSEVFDWANRINWEKDTFDAMDCLTPETTFIDIGAWIGTMTLYAKDKCKRILSFEPDPVALATLTQNVALNQVPAEIYPVAVAGYDGTLKIGSGLLGASTTRANPKAGGGIGAWDEAQTAEVPCTTLPSLITAYNVADPLFIKIDIEGSEEGVLASSFDWLKKHKPNLYIELHPWWWTETQKTENLIRELMRAYMAGPYRKALRTQQYLFLRVQ